MSEYHKEMTVYYNIEIFMDNKTYYIPEEQCLRTSEIVESYNEVAQDVFNEYCLKEPGWLAAEYVKYNFIIIIFIVVVVLALLILIIFMVGFYTVIDNLFYVFSCHWILVCIIKMREGQDMSEEVDNSLKEIVENDEEVAGAIIDTENDDEEEPLGTQSRSDNWKGDKIKERKKKLKLLEEQYKICLQGDKYSNDEERVYFEESAKRMQMTI